MGSNQGTQGATMMRNPNPTKKVSSSRYGKNEMMKQVMKSTNYPGGNIASQQQKYMQATLNSINPSQTGMKKHNNNALEILTNRNVPRSLDRYAMDPNLYHKSGHLESVSQRILNNKKNLGVIQGHEQRTP